MKVNQENYYLNIGYDKKCKYVYNYRGVRYKK